MVKTSNVACTDEGTGGGLPSPEGGGRRQVGEGEGVFLGAPRPFPFVALVDRPAVVVVADLPVAAAAVAVAPAVGGASRDPADGSRDEFFMAAVQFGFLPELVFKVSGTKEREKRKEGGCLG